MKFEKRIAIFEFASILLIELLVLPILLPQNVNFSNAWDIGIVISEFVLVAPALILLVIWYFINMWKSYKYPEYEALSISERLMFAPVKFRTLLWTVLFTIVMGPIASLFNAISLIFTDNVILEQSMEILQLPAWVAFFITAIYGPVCEEFTFRGIVYGGLRRYCKPLPAIVMSGLMFGLMHMNFNQFGYAFVLGIGMALIVEASGSIISSILLHLLVNGSAIIDMYMIERFQRDALNTLMEQDITSDSTLISSIIVFALLSAVCIWLGGKILRKIAKLEDREDPITLIRHSKNYKGKTVWSVLLVASIAVYLYIMVSDYLMGL